MLNFKKLVELRLLSEREELLSKHGAELPGMSRPSARWPSKNNAVVKKTKAERRATQGELQKGYWRDFVEARAAAKAGDWSSFDDVMARLPDSYKTRVRLWCQNRDLMRVRR
jgi:hypothetical protein